MWWRLTSIIGFTILILSNCSQQVKQKNGYQLVHLNNKSLEIVALPEVGGRVVQLNIPEKRNMLKADTLLWYEAPNFKPDLAIVDAYKPYHGHVVWLGPMSDWWKKQSLYPEKKANGSRWPPDPYLDYGSYSWSRTDLVIKMSGPESPISGVQLEKVITLDKEQPKVTFTALATNVRDSSLSFDIWHNTRLEADCRCFVPVDNSNSIWFKTRTNETYDSLSYIIKNGFFSFLPPPTLKKQFHTSKAYIYPSKPYMAAFCHDQVLIITFPFHSIESIHPEQALVEVFNQYSILSHENLLELEHHSAYQKVIPGEAISAMEDWWIFEFSNQEDMERIKFLQLIEPMIINN